MFALLLAFDVVTKVDYDKICFMYYTYTFPFSS